jgi:hypothetical protein
LQATALVHEAWLRLVGHGPQQWNNRGHFFAAAAEAMRRILIEAARRKQSQRRGGGLERVDLDDAQLVLERPADEMLAVDEALEKTPAGRFFGGGVGQAAIFHRYEFAGDSRSTRHLPPHCGPALDLRPHLVARRDRKRRTSLSAKKITTLLWRDSFSVCALIG